MNISERRSRFVERLGTIVAVMGILFLCSAPAGAFGVDFLDSPAGIRFGVDVRIEGTQFADPYDDVLFFAWQSTHKGVAASAPGVGGHWGFQVLPVWRDGRSQPCFTFNFGWEFHHAVLPLGVEGMVTSASHPDPYVIDVSERMKAEIERNIADNPTSPNLFLSYGAGGGISGTAWPETTYNYVPWALNTWYRVSFTRDESPAVVTAWVLKRYPSGVYYFPNEPEQVTAFGWHIRIQPETQDPNGVFTPDGSPMELPTLYLGVAFDRLHTWTTWGEAFDDRPWFPITLYQSRPRVTSLAGAIQEIPRAHGNYWGYDQPSNAFGPVGDSQATHAFYIGYTGAPLVDGVQFELMRRSTPDGAILWDDLSPVSRILLQAEILKWPEDTLVAYFASFPDICYSADEVTYEGEVLHVNRTLRLAGLSSPLFEYSGLYGFDASSLKFDAHAAERSWLVKDREGRGFQIASPENREKFHIEIEVYDPHYINRAGWLHFEVIPNADPVCPKPNPVSGALVAHWKFDETSGTTAHDSAGNNDGYVSEFGTDWAQGHEGGALNFAGQTGYVEVYDSPPLNPTQAVTFAAWIKPSWTGNNRILQKGLNDDQYRLLREGASFVFHLSGVSNGRLACSSFPPQGQWHHVAATYDGSVMKLFYDAVLVRQQNATGEIDVTSDLLCIGAKYPGAPWGDVFDGLMDEVRIYDYALSAEEIAALCEGTGGTTSRSR